MGSPLQPLAQGRPRTGLGSDADARPVVRSPRWPARRTGWWERRARPTNPSGQPAFQATSPPLLLDDEQVIAIAVSLRAAAASGAEIEEAAARALLTIHRVLPPRLRHRLDALTFTTSSHDALRTPAVPTDVLIAVSGAIRAHEELRFGYAGPAEPVPDDPPGPPRKVEPHHLVAARGRWYLVAWDLGRGDWRIFRADRMAPRAGPGRRFAPRTVPGGDVHGFLEARFKGATESNAWPCRGTVVLDLPARDVVPFAGDGVVEDLGADRCSLEVGSWSWTALAASLGRFDAPIEVVHPAELRSAFGELAQRYASTARGGSARP